MIDLYQTLGVKPDAGNKQIKAAYRRKALRYHPDRGGDADAFRAVQLAFDILTDPERRRRYDATGDVGDASLCRDPAEAEVLAMVGGAFCQAMRDPIDWMLDKINEDRECHRRTRNDIAKAIERMIKHLAKFESRKVKSDRAAGKVLIIEAARANIAAAERDLAACDAAIAHCERKLGVLDGLDGLASGEKPLRASWPPDSAVFMYAIERPTTKTE